MSEKVILVPRNDFVIVDENVIDTYKGIALPQKSVQGKEYVVYAIGPKVEGLAVGDKVMMTGVVGVDWSYIPNHKNKIIIREGNIVLLFQDTETKMVVSA